MLAPGTVRIEVMVGTFGMDDKNRSYNQLILGVCGVVVLVVVFVLVGIVVPFGEP